MDRSIYIESITTGPVHVKGYNDVHQGFQVLTRQCRRENLNKDFFTSPWAEKDDLSNRCQVFVKNNLDNQLRKCYIYTILSVIFTPS